MSLWTPYVSETPLDLTKTVKEERHSPLLEPRQEVNQLEYYSQYHVTQETLPQHLPYYNGYYQPAMYSVPSSQMSPMSGASSCSGYDTTICQPIARPATLSPPESPASLDRTRNYLVEADILSDDPDFQAFERDALRAMAEKNGGTLLGNNPRMRRAVKSTNQDAADDSYRKQRERNNFAAKQSRDRRKLREIHLALKVAYLKNEVSNLKAKLAVKTCARCQRQCDC